MTCEQNVVSLGNNILITINYGDGSGLNGNYYMDTLSNYQHYYFQVQTYQIGINYTVNSALSIIQNLNLKCMIIS